jgi:hypothetical protein
MEFRYNCRTGYLENEVGIRGGIENFGLYPFVGGIKIRLGKVSLTLFK